MCKRKGKKFTEKRQLQRVRAELIVNKQTKKLLQNKGGLRKVTFTVATEELHMTQVQVFLAKHRALKFHS